MKAIIYTGPIGFIKNPFAQRSALLNTQRYLTSSIIDGIGAKLGVNIKRHRLLIDESTYGVTNPNEDLERTTPPSGFANTKNKDTGTGITNMIRLRNPVLILGFQDDDDLGKVVSQSIRLCRKEDILFPIKNPNTNTFVFDYNFDQDDESVNEELYEKTTNCDHEHLILMSEAFPSKMGSVNAEFMGQHYQTKREQYVDVKFYR